MRALRAVCLAGLAFFAGCEGRVDVPFELVYLTYGRPDYPMGMLVRVHHDANSWVRQGQLELARDAVFLHPPPFPPGKVPFVSVIEAGGELTSALWLWTQREQAAPEFRLPLTGRLVVLAARHPTSNRAAICYYSSAHIDMVTAEFQRRAATVGANARCSLAILDLDRADSLVPIGGCRHIAPAWLPDGSLAFIDRGDRLVRLLPDGQRLDTLLPEARAFSVSADGRLCATGLNGTLRFYTEMGDPEGEPIDSVYAPLLSPDGRYLAFRHNDNDLWIRDLESGVETEVGLGDPRNWSADSRLLLFQGRKRDESGRLHMAFRVADAASGVSVALPDDGFIVDAVLLTPEPGP